MRRLKMPYSTPRLVPYSLSGLVACVRERSSENGWPVENRPSLPGTQPPPLIIEGFEGEVGDLVQSPVIDWMALVWKPRARRKHRKQCLKTVRGP